MALVRRIGVVFGIAFTFGGILGFVPGVIKDDMYLGIFRVNDAHNLLHLASGALFFVASAIGARLTRWWLILFGTLYAVMAGEGLKVGTGMICGCISNNRADAWGHAGLATAMLLAGLLVPAAHERPAR